MPPGGAIMLALNWINNNLDIQLIIWGINQTEMSNIAGSNPSDCCCSLFYIIVNLMYPGFELLIGEEMQFEDVT